MLGWGSRCRGGPAGRHLPGHGGAGRRRCCPGSAAAVLGVPPAAGAGPGRCYARNAGAGPARSAPPRPARGRHRQGEHGHGHGGSGAASPGGSRPPRGERDARPQPTLPLSPKSPQNSPYPRPRVSLASTSVQGCSGRLATLGLGVCEEPRMSRGYPQERGGARRTGRGGGSWRGRGGRRALPASCPGSINLPGESQPGETHHCLQDPQKPAGPICSALASPPPRVPPRLGDVAARSWQLGSAHLPLSLPQFPSLARCRLQHGHTTPPHCRDMKGQVEPRGPNSFSPFNTSSSLGGHGEPPTPKQQNTSSNSAPSAQGCWCGAQSLRGPEAADGRRGGGGEAGAGENCSLATGH